MTTDQLQTQITDLRTTVRKLEKATVTPSGDIDADLDLETRLGASQRLLVRLETQVSQLRAREEADREKQAREAAQARLSEIDTIYEEQCSDFAQIVNKAALFLEPVLSAVLQKRGELRALNNEFYRLYKQVHGEKPDVLAQPWRVALIPGEFPKLPEPSPLYGHVALALFAGVSEHESGPYTLPMILAVLEGAQKPQEVVNPPKATPKPAEDGSLTPMQSFAKQRRTNLG